MALEGAEPQAILTPITEAAVFLTLTVELGAEEAVADLLSDLGGVRRSVGFRAPDAGLACVAGIGAGLWDRLFGAPRPAGLHPFRELRGARHTAPATPGDLFLHVRAARLDLCFELGRLLVDRLRGGARVVDEVHGFRSFDERDLLGFVDGTENPEGAAASAAVLVGEEDAAFAGGSYLVAQKYLHDLAAWNALSVEQQEEAFGRTKLDDVEFPDERKAPDSHLVLNTIVNDQGEQQQIMRFNMPFGRVGSEEFGTFYAAYCRTPAVIEQMLENMFLGKPPGTHDRILDFSTAVTGGLFFVPSLAILEGPTTVAAAPGPDEKAAPGAGGGSLEIGSLKGE